ncbi:MAG: tetratricopeptide repeat protein [Candidatus Promineifilaceae bacterium]
MIDAERTQHLEKQLAKLDDAPEPRIREKIDLLNDLAWHLADTDTKRSLTLGESAYRLAESSGGNGSPYKEGMAYSLRTQGYLNQRHGNHSTGLVQLMKAKEIFESLGIIDGLPDVYDGIAGIYFQVGSFPNALTYTYRQLDAAVQVGDKRLIANAYNNLAVIYIESEDYEQGEVTRDKCLKLAIESGHTRVECISYINIAEVRLRTDRYQQALEFALRSLDLSREAGFELFEIYALDILGKTYLRLGETDRGLKILESVLALSRTIDAKPSECMVLLSLGNTYLEMQEPDRAVEWLEQSLNVAQTINASVEVYKTYRALSKAYEQKGDYWNALAYYKQYQAIRGQVLSNVETLRTNILEITHQTEAAKKEAEIERFRAIELEREVEERTAELSSSIVKLEKEVAKRKQAEAEIQQMVELLEERVAERSRELAALYDMTLLYAGAQDLTDILEPALRHICRSVGGDAIAVHVVTADEEQLQLVAQDSIDDWREMQRVRLPSEFVTWLKAAEAPIMLVNGKPEHSFLPAEIVPSNYATYIGLPLRLQSGVIGMLGVYRDQPRPFNVNAVSLLIMMAEQLSIIVQNHRLQDQAQQITRSLERQRLSREMHDSIAQHIYSLHLFARAGQDALADGDPSQANRHLQQLDKNALIALREMRLLLYQLGPSALESHTLAGAIEERFAHVERRLGIEAAVKAAEMPDLPEAVEEDLYYMITEALNNALKHAAASRVDVYFEFKDGRMMISVRDNGKGFDSSQPSVGLGLENLCKRATQIEGLVELETEPGQGTTIRISLVTE